MVLGPGVSRLQNPLLCAPGSEGAWACEFRFMKSTVDLITETRKSLAKKGISALKRNSRMRKRISKVNV